MDDEQQPRSAGQRPYVTHGLAGVASLPNLSRTYGPAMSDGERRWERGPGPGDHGDPAHAPGQAGDALARAAASRAMSGERRYWRVVVTDADGQLVGRTAPVEIEHQGEAWSVQQVADGLTIELEVRSMITTEWSRAPLQPQPLVRPRVIVAFGVHCSCLQHTIGSTRWVYVDQIHQGCPQHGRITIDPTPIANDVSRETSPIPAGPGDGLHGGYVARRQVAGVSRETSLPGREPEHPTCIEVTNLGTGPGAEQWLCGPDCPPDEPTDLA